jgi:glycosyltransferase involved in cell wall biosynthesis
MNEALAAGLPVIMTHVDPNNKILPKEWLVGVREKSQFMARIMITVYESNIQELADKITEWATDEKDTDRKIKARKIAEEEYSSQAVLEKWALLLKKLGV